MIAPNPFTPKSGWEPKVFVGRDKEIELFKRKLEEAKQGRCDHFLILGEWGIGKTSLLKEFKKIAQEKGYLASLITVGEYTENSNFNDGVKQLVEEIPQRFPADFTKFKELTQQLNGLGVQVLGTGFNLSRVIQEWQPQTFLFNFLKILWKDLQKETKVAVVLLDDVQNFAPISGIFTILKNVLSDEEMVKNTKFLFVLSSTPKGWDQFLELHHPIGRYFTPRLELERLNKKRTFEALNKILKGTGVDFSENIKEKIYEYTKGHPYELQVLCSKLCDNQIEGKATDKEWDISLNDALREVGKNVFDILYSKTSKQERIILYLLSLVTSPIERKEILSLCKKYNLENRFNFKFPENIISTILYRLLNKCLLIKLEKNSYSLPDRFFGEYIVRIKGYNGEGDKI
ncbi:DUF2791 family P-loop domain-containing protein [Candidatus Woesearchaeota archaeon]|nr:DUF2791 family P-loop domain-containing protein [Candidatus Woesearchaeota archaeon]